MSIKRFSNPDKYLNFSSTMGTATGGIITSSGGYTYHTFTVEDGNESTSFTSSVSRTVEVLVVAGGGQGGGQVGGGGGAGGVVYNSSVSVTANTPVTVQVGRGGTTQEHSAYGGGGGSRVSQVPGENYSYTYTQQVGSRGDNSVFGTITAVGGGGGGGYSEDFIAASSGGSGGGGGGGNTTPSSSTQTNSGGGTGYGFSGGTGVSGNWSGGGGGGAGGAGGNASATNSGTGGIGGAAISFFGDWYAEGGSGCSNGPAGRVETTRRLGGFGGHSNSGGFVYAQRSGDGRQATGSGGGGARDNDRIGRFAGGSFSPGNLDYVGFGGSGIVIVRYI
jgi:hypothetical protein